VDKQQLEMHNVSDSERAANLLPHFLCVVFVPLAVSSCALALAATRNVDYYTMYILSA